MSTDQVREPLRELAIAMLAEIDILVGQREGGATTDFTLTNPGTHRGFNGDAAAERLSARLLSLHQLIERRGPTAGRIGRIWFTSEMTFAVF